MKHPLMCTVTAVLMMLGVPAVYAADTKPPEAVQDTPAPAQTQDAAPADTPAGTENAVRFKVDPQTQRGKDEYDAAIKNLTPEQLAELGALEKAFAATMEIDMQIFHRAAEMEHCISRDAFFKADQQNIKAFVAWRDEMLKVQEKRQNEHMAQRLKIKYVKPYVLNRYYVYQAKMLKMLGAAVAKNAYDSGAFKNTDCDDLSKRLKQGL